MTTWLCLHACSAIVLCIAVLNCNGTTALLFADEIVIDLARGQRDPLVEFVPPAIGSPDVTQFTSRGLRIKQRPEISGHRSGSTGFKVLLPARGNFRAELAMKIFQLEPSRSGWGQGIVFMVLFDDSQQTALKISQVALAPDGKQMTMTENMVNGKAVHKTYPTALRDGRLIISRSSSRASLGLAQGAERQVLAELECPNADVSGVEVWCTRVNEGNRSTDILVESLKFEADEFIAFREGKPRFLSKWRVIFAVQLALLLGLLFWAWKQKRQRAY